MIVRGYMLHGLRPYFRWFDLWIGVFVKVPDHRRVWIPDSLDPAWVHGYREAFEVYVQPLPMLGVRFKISREPVHVKRAALDAARSVTP